MSRLLKLALALLALGLIAWFIAALPAWVWHPLVGRGYQLWSGIASDVSEITLPIGLLTGLIAARQFLHQHFECHTEECSRLGFHHIEGTPHRSCWEHHPVLSEHSHHGVPLHVIHERHQQARDRIA